MNFRKFCVSGVMGLWCVGLCVAQNDKPNRPPQLLHTPVTKAVRGQPISMKATVTDDRKQVDSVTLYYTLSSDAAPFSLPMRNAGLGVYLGTIDAGVLAGAHSVSYYLEAQDAWGASTETPWYIVEIRDPSSKGSTPAAEDTSSSAPAKKQRDLTVPLSVIAGSAVAVVGGAVLLSGGGGGGGGSSNNDTNDLAAKSGTYNGSVTTCFTPDGGSPACESHAMSIVVDINGNVLSDTLRDGVQVVSTLSGNDFALTATIDNNGETGQIVYSGTLVDNNRIVGSIDGSSIGGASGAGSYSGSFTANK